MNFISTSGQDQFLFEYFFRGKRNGVFVDATVFEGETSSSSLFFERFMGWGGLCVESSPERFAKLTAARKCVCERAEIDSLPSLLQKHGLAQVDYCAIDANGGELAVLSAIDFNQHHFGILAIANSEAEPRIAGLLQQQGFQLAAKFGKTGVFKSATLARLPRTSVICAVWHGDADRMALLEGHAANLARQTVPVEPIYVFDGSDVPPTHIAGRKVVAHENLSIYQAWNVALAMVSTPFVMNLNLDDRLAPDAVETLETTLMRESAALVGGDWKICYSQEETDAVLPCFPADELAFVETWPPPRGTPTRLGSGKGERGTLGPATLWRTDLHIGVPRYPWRFTDGSVVKVIADSCWWTLVTQHLKRKAVRMADVIGNYHSHPNEQAEFRGGGATTEAQIMNAIGVSLI